MKNIRYEIATKPVTRFKEESQMSVQILYGIISRRVKNELRKTLPDIKDFIYNNFFRRRNQMEFKRNILYIGHGDRAGIDISYNRSKQSFYISGWYDTMVGIEGEEISLKELLEVFKITKKDIENLELKQMKNIINQIMLCCVNIRFHDTSVMPLRYIYMCGSCESNQVWIDDCNKCSLSRVFCGMNDEAVRFIRGNTFSQICFQKLLYILNIVTYEKDFFNNKERKLVCCMLLLSTPHLRKKVC